MCGILITIEMGHALVNIKYQYRTKRETSVRSHKNHKEAQRAILVRYSGRKIRGETQ